MRPLRSLLIYLVVVLLAGALVAPWVYGAVQRGAQHFPALASLARQPFHRYVHRAMLALAVVGLWPFLRSLGANSWAAMGMTKSSGQWQRLAAGLALGFGSLAGVALMALVWGARSIQEDLQAKALLEHLLGASMTAAAVSVLEELLFRGALFGALKRAHPWGVALLISSAVYSMAHFFQRPPTPETVTCYSGLVTLAQMFRGFTEIELLAPGFFTLLLAGLILGFAFQRTGTLYFSIGLHAGWIFWLEFYNYVTTPVPRANVWFWGTGKLIDGWLALAVMAAVGVVVGMVLKRKAATGDGV